MKILHVSDLHLRWFDWVLDEGQKYDLLVISGDLMDGFSGVPLRTQVKQCTNFLLNLTVRAAVVTGNHDVYVKSHYLSIDTGAEGLWLRRLGGKGNIIAVDGDVVEIDGVFFGCLGWLQSPRWSVIPDIVVAHAPPAACPCATAEYGHHDFGDSELSRYLNGCGSTAPRLILSGHVHNAVARSCVWPNEVATTILNAGCDPSAPTPTHWILDTDVGEAWFQDGYGGTAVGQKFTI